MSQIRRFVVTVLIASFVVYIVHGLEIQPGMPELEFSLSEQSRASLEGMDAAQAQLAGGLEGLFGAPHAPGFAVTEEWAEEGFDPNRPDRAADDYGSGEIGDEEREKIAEGNRHRFDDQIAAIGERRFDDVDIPTWMPALRDEWELYLDQNREGSYEPFNTESYQGDMEYVLTNWYPKLEDSAELYRQQCFHCHGVNGGGDGPTATFLNPLPRDYRLGIFKFTALSDKARPRREDLYRILHDGVTGTAMPSFARFTPAELHGLVDYVRYLSIRGEVERLLVDDILDATALLPSKLQEEYEFVWSKWFEAGDYFTAYDGIVPRPEDSYPGTDKTYLEMGAFYFPVEEQSDCSTCHGADGKGKGASAFEPDPNDPGLDPENPLLKYVDDDWGHPIEPRNFHRGVFRFGDRPIDMYRRIHNGINGSPMPAHADYPPEKIWALVHYVRSLSRGENAPPTAGTGPAMNASH